MWDQEEHCRFLRGSLSFTVRNRTVWQGLETGARNDRHSPRETNPIALSKICQESRQDGQENQAQGTQLPMPRCGPRVWEKTLPGTLHAERSHQTHSQPNKVNDSLRMPFWDRSQLSSEGTQHHFARPQKIVARRPNYRIFLSSDFIRESRGVAAKSRFEPLTYDVMLILEPQPKKLFHRSEVKLMRFSGERKEEMDSLS